MENQRALSLSLKLYQGIIVVQKRKSEKEKPNLLVWRICSRCSRYLAFGRVSSEVFNAFSQNGGSKNVLWCSSTFWRKMCSGLVFFSWIHPPKFSFLRCRLHNKTQQKRGISRSHTNESASENATQKKRVLITNSPVVGTVENEIDFFSVRRPFRSTLCWLNAYRGERSSISSNACRIFSPLFSGDGAVEREKKSQKSRGRTHRQKGRLRFFFFKRSPHFFSLSLSRVNCRKLKRRTFKECPPVFQHDYKNIK